MKMKVTLWAGKTSLIWQWPTIYNLEYAKLKRSNFAAEILKTEPITALFDTGATYSCISQLIFKKIADKINMIRKSLKINTVSGAILGPIGITPLDLNILLYLCTVTKTVNTAYY